MLLTENNLFLLAKANKLSLKKMKINIIKGKFKPDEALSIITKMIDVKIKFQEEKIKTSDNEEDIKMRENRIKSLQKELYESRKFIESHRGLVSLQSEIYVD
jgi:ribosomal protein S15P/S13E